MEVYFRKFDTELITFIDPEIVQYLGHQKFIFCLN